MMSCSVVVNDILDALKYDNQRLVDDMRVLKAENERFLQDLCLERQLNHILDNYKNYTLVMVNRCRCDGTHDVINKLNKFNDEYNCLKSRRSDPNNGLVSGVSPTDEVVMAKTMDDLMADPQVCPQCDQVFGSGLDLEIHMNSVHKNVESFTCHECHQVFNSRDLFVVHLQQHSDNNNTNADEVDVKPDISSLNTSPTLSPGKWGSVRRNAKKNGMTSNFQLMTELLHKTYQNDGKSIEKVVTNDGKYLCSKCGLKFDSEMAYEMHVNKLHRKKKPFKCSECPFQFYAKRQLQNHLSLTHNIQAFECDLCHFKTAKYHYLMGHKKRQHSPSSTPTNDHKKAAVGPSAKGRPPIVESFKCDLCDFKTSAKYSYVLHKNSHKLNKQFRCVAAGCTKRFTSESAKIRHQKSAHKMLGQKFMCGPCDQYFPTNGQLMNHMGAKHQVPAFACDLCSFKTVLKSTLFRHKVTDHSLDASYVCRYSDCGKAFENDRNLQRHYKRTHQSDSKSPQVLTKVAKHSPKKTPAEKSPKPVSKSAGTASATNVFKCDIIGCRKKFVNESKLIVHKRMTHNIVSMLSCDWTGCRRKFKTLTKLGEHKRQHKAMENKFGCPWKGCTFRTDTFAKLNQHRRSLGHNSNNL